LRLFNGRKPVIRGGERARGRHRGTVLLPMDVRIASSEAASASFLAARHRSRSGVELFLRASSASRRRWSGAIRAASSGPRKRSAESWSAAWWRRADLIATARAQARLIHRQHRAGVVALIRQMMWRMARRSHPMEAHRLDSKAMSIARSADVKEGIIRSWKAPCAVHAYPSRRACPNCQWGEEPGYR